MTAKTPLVVVGVDGSSCSLEALKYAVEDARRRGAHLRIVSAWGIPAMAYAGVAAAIDPRVFREAAEAASAIAVEEARRMDASLVIDAVVPENAPTTALLDAAREADVLIVGSRGHGGFSSLLLGSVSTQLAHHAPCPITIIHSSQPS